MCVCKWHHSYIIKHSIFDLCTNFGFIGCLPIETNWVKGKTKTRKNENKLRLWNCVITSLFIAFDCFMRQKSSYYLFKRHPVCVVLKKKISIFYVVVLFSNRMFCSNFSSFPTQYFAENDILTTSCTISGSSESKFFNFHQFRRKNVQKSIRNMKICFGCSKRNLISMSCSSWNWPVNYLINTEEIAQRYSIFKYSLILLRLFQQNMSRKSSYN